MFNVELKLQFFRDRRFHLNCDFHRKLLVSQVTTAVLWSYFLHTFLPPFLSFLPSFLTLKTCFAKRKPHGVYEQRSSACSFSFEAFERTKEDFAALGAPSPLSMFALTTDFSSRSPSRPGGAFAKRTAGDEVRHRVLIATPSPGENKTTASRR